MTSEAAIRKLTDSQAESLIRLYEKGEARIVSEIEYTTIPHLKGLIGRDGYEDWGSVAKREKAGGA